MFKKVQGWLQRLGGWVRGALGIGGLEPNASDAATRPGATPMVPPPWPAEPLAPASTRIAASVSPGVAPAGSPPAELAALPIDEPRPGLPAGGSQAPRVATEIHPAPGDDPGVSPEGTATETVLLVSAVAAVPFPEPPSEVDSTETTSRAGEAAVAEPLPIHPSSETEKGPRPDLPASPSSTYCEACGHIVAGDGTPHPHAPRPILNVK